MVMDFFTLCTFKTENGNGNDYFLKNSITHLWDRGSTLKWQLKYRATRDRFKSKSIHSKCDGVRNTLSVIMITSGNVFGDYAEQAWRLTDHVTDPKSFMFSLINKENNSFKAPCTNGGLNALNCVSTLGLSFGGSKGSRDICINSDSFSCLGSYSKVGCHFKHPDCPYGSQGTKTILVGTQEFNSVEIKVFAKIEWNKRGFFTFVFANLSIKFSFH